MEFLLSDFYLTVGWKYQQNDRRAMLGRGLVWSGPAAATAAAAAADQPQLVVKPHDLTQSSFIGTFLLPAPQFKNHRDYLED